MKIIRKIRDPRKNVTGKIEYVRKYSYRISKSEKQNSFYFSVFWKKRLVAIILVGIESDNDYLWQEKEPMITQDEKDKIEYFIGDNWFKLYDALQYAS